ncbi:MAG: Stf0 family sulfotransferase [Pseudomonadota bacterium]
MDDIAPGYMICTSPRSGSTFLCRLLRETGVAGRPGSYFHGATLKDWAENLDLPGDLPDVSQIIEAALEKGRAGGSLFGLRQQSHSFALLRQTLAAWHPEATDRARLEAVVGPLRYIHLTRPDKLAQAVSYIRAAQSGIWHRNADGSIYEELPRNGASGYDFIAIRDQVAEFEQADTAWREWFDREGIQPLKITYDALAADPKGILADVLAWIGLDRSHADDAEPPTQKLADAVTVEWMARYRAEVNAGVGHE